MKEHLVYSSETLKTCIRKILKNGQWKTASKYLRSSLVFVKELPQHGHYALYRGSSGYYIANNHYTQTDMFLTPIREVTRIPQFVAQTLMGKDHVTEVIGPYIFINNIEDTSMARYLINELQYAGTLLPRTKQKIDNILEDYAYWIQVDETFADILNKIIINVRRSVNDN